MTSPDREPRARFGLVAGLALRDYRHEWIMSGCFVLALTAVLIPLLVLFGLKFGIINNLFEPLKQDPRYREITPSGSGDYDPAWFTVMEVRPDVAFVVPRTRVIAATIKLYRPGGDGGRILDVELVPSAPGDPVLDSELPAPEGYRQVAISADAADKLGVRPGDRLEGLITRVRADRQESVTLDFEIGSIAPPGAFARDGLFVSGALMEAVEDYRDGRAVAALDWEGSAVRTGPRSFAGFRLYARSIDGVAGLRTQLLAAGIDVRTRVADIDLVKKLDRNLSVIFWIIALITVTGYCLALGASVWAGIDRKRREFSVLRLVGFRTRAILWFPILQSLLTGLLGWVLACCVYFLVAGVLNTMFLSTIGAGQSVCRLLPAHLLLALALTLAIAAIPAAAGGLRLARLEPSGALRE